MMRPTKLLACLALGLGLTLPGAAHAADRKVQPGHMCVRDYSTSGGIFYTDSVGGVWNDSTTSTLTVLCPFVRDNESSPWISITARVRDLHGGDQLCCTAYSRSELGALSSSNQQCTGITNNLTSLTFPSLIDSNNGYFYLRCVIPPKTSTASRSGIWSYRIDEP